MITRLARHPGPSSGPAVSVGLRTRLWLALGLLLILAPARLAAQGDGAAAFAYERYDVDITLNADGSFVVREDQTIRFDGRYSEAFAEIPRQFTGRISGVSVADPDGPFEAGSGPRTFSLSQRDDALEVVWGFTPTVAGERRSFSLQYTVHEGLFVYPQEHRLDWEVFPADRAGLPVEAGRFTLHFPTAVDPAAILVDVRGPTVSVGGDDRNLSLTLETPVPDGVAFLVLVTFPPDLVAVTNPPPWQAAQDQATLRFRVTDLALALIIQPDGLVEVEEHQSVAVELGSLASGFQSLSLRQLDRVDAVQVFEGETPFSLEPGACAYCYWLETIPRGPDWVTYDPATFVLQFNERQFGASRITWDFPPLFPGDATTFRLRYVAAGALRLLDSGQELNWIVTPGFPTAVERATVTLRVPPDVDPLAVIINDTAAGTRRLQTRDGLIRLEHQGPIPPNTSWQISVGLPAGATTAARSVWQQELEAVLAAAQAAQLEQQRALAAASQARSRRQLIAGAVSLATLVLGLVTALLLWYRWGRDEPALDEAGPIEGPPSDLPPGIVAYLLDEGPSSRGVLASLFQLAGLGLLQIDVEPVPGALRLKRNWDGPLDSNQPLVTPAGDTVVLPEHVVSLFDRVRGIIPTDDTVNLDDVGSKLALALPPVYHAMGLEADRFFAARPDQVRRRWLVAGQWLILGAAVAVIGAALVLADDLGWIALGPPGAALLVGLVLTLMSRFMPRRTSAGADEAARWRAFRDYLEDMARRIRDDESRALEEAQTILDRHFAYAVALGVAEGVINRLERPGGRAPTWSLPMEWVRDPAPHPTEQPGSPRPRWRARPGSGALPPPPAGTREPPSGQPGRPAGNLSALSSALTRGLETASHSLAGLLNSAVLDQGDDTPFELVIRGTGEIARFSWKAGTTTGEILRDILADSGSGAGSGGYSRGPSSRWRSSASTSRRVQSRSSGRIRSSIRIRGGRRGFR